MRKKNRRGAIFQTKREEEGERDGDIPPPHAHGVISGHAVVEGEVCEGAAKRQTKRILRREMTRSRTRLVSGRGWVF